MDLLPAGFMLRLEDCFLLLAAEVDKWIFSPVVTASDKGQRNRCKEWAPREEADQMGTLSWDFSFHVSPRWQAGEWRRDSTLCQSPWQICNNYKCTTRLLCLPSLSQKGIRSLYRVLVKPRPKWACNRSMSGYLGRIFD